MYGLWPPREPLPQVEGAAAISQFQQMLPCGDTKNTIATFYIWNLTIFVLAQIFKNTLWAKQNIPVG